MKLIVGLGNPGPQYAGTRHNVGFDVVDILARRWSTGMESEKFHGWFGQADVGGERAALMKPTTFMNRSGRAVLAAGQFYKLELPDLLVIADDLALPVGKIRIRAKGSAGSHNGLKSIIDTLGSDEWSRLRIGIGDRVGSGASFVLSRFDREEEEVMGIVRERAADAVEHWIRHGTDLTMTRFNGEVIPPAER